MLTSLLRSSKELDVYASDADFLTKVFSEALTPMSEMYNLNVPLYPQPIALENFPLDFQAPEGMTGNSVTLIAISDIILLLISFFALMYSIESTVGSSCK